MAGTLTFKLTGVNAMLRNLKRIEAAVPGETEKAIRIEAELIMTRSKRDHVPVDLGTLRASGLVNPPRRKGKSIEVVMSYGNAAAPYALAIHEHPSVHSPPTWQGVVIDFNPRDRGPKYLERPLMDAIPGMAGRLASELMTLTA